MNDSITINNLELKQLKNFKLGEYIPTSSLSNALDDKYDAKYFPEKSLIADETANVYKNIKCAKIQSKVFE